MIKVKVCGMVDPVNLMEVAKAEPDFLGFIFYTGSKRYVGIDPVISIFNTVPHQIKKTGVFVDEDPSVIISVAARYGLDYVQLHGNEPVEHCRLLQKAGLRIIKAFEISDDFDFMMLDGYTESCDFFLFDTKTGKTGGSGSKFNWDKLNEYRSGKPFFLSGGIGPEDALAVRQVSHKDFFAVDINSRFEIRPGIKDSNKVRIFIKEIKL